MHAIAELEEQQVQQPAVSGEQLIQVQPVNAPHERRLRIRRRHGLAVHLAAAHPHELRPALDR